MLFISMRSCLKNCQGSQPCVPCLHCFPYLPSGGVPCLPQRSFWSLFLFNCTIKISIQRIYSIKTFKTDLDCNNYFDSNFPNDFIVEGVSYSFFLSSSHLFVLIVSDSENILMHLVNEQMVFFYLSPVVVFVNC